MGRRILFCIKSLDSTGGLESILVDKVNGLAERGMDINLLIHHENISSKYELDPRVSLLSCGINYNYLKSYFSFENVWLLFRHLKAIKRVINSLNPDVIVVTHYSPDIYFFPLLAKSHYLIKEFHSSGYVAYTSRFGSRIKKILERVLYRFYDTLIVLNSDEVQYYKHRDIRVLPNFIPTRYDTSCATRKKVIVAAGRINGIKRYDHLILAWSQIEHLHPDWSLHIYGEGDKGLLKRYEKTIRNFGLIHIKFCGNTDDLLSIFAASSIFALTSFSDCFPMVMLESLSVGLPVVSYDCPWGPRHILDVDSGILVESGNIDDFASELSRLISDDMLRDKLSVGARKRAEIFDRNSTLHRWQEFLTGIRVD